VSGREHQLLDADEVKARARKQASKLVARAGI
jgi:hypothetical protein